MSVIFCGEHGFITSAVYRFMVVERNVLHRDMSLFNVRMYPKHLIEYKSKFINDVLKKAKE